MKQGVILCGLNGSGKSTLGRALAQRLGWEFLDIEDCFFPKTDPSYLYANPRSPQEAAALLVERATAAENFVLASVKGHYPGLAPLLTGAVWLRVDKATRARRVRQRSYEKFGERMGPGGRPVPAGGRFLRLYRPTGGQRSGGLAGHVTLPRGGGGRHFAHPGECGAAGWPLFPPVKHKKQAAVELSRRLLFCAKTGPAEVAGPVPR